MDCLSTCASLRTFLLLSAEVVLAGPPGSPPEPQIKAFKGGLWTANMAAAEEPLRRVWLVAVASETANAPFCSFSSKVAQPSPRCSTASS